MDQLLETIASERPETGPYRNYYFQPERLQVSSEADQNVNVSADPNAECFYNQFTIQLPRPALEVKSIQLVRASIPNPQTCIPDQETTFWYYRVPASDLNPLNPAQVFYPGHLHMVRLLPSWYKQELNADSSLYGFNKTFQDYESLATELAKSTLNDPLNGYSPLFIPGDISLVYDTSGNKFKFEGNNVFNSQNVFQYAYISAGYLDPNIYIAQKQLQLLSQEYDGYGPYPPQEYQQYKTLNLRLGFTWDGGNRNLYSIGNIPTSSGINNVLAYRFRPPISFVQTLSLGSEVPSDYIYTAETYANLVYTNCVNLFGSFIAGATTDSIQNTQLVASVPMNAQNLGITFYNPVISNPLTKIQGEIYQITIQLFTDTGQPYNLPNSAIASMEFALTF
jgi:hypothetical protein